MKKGFTLAELLITVVIVAVLAAVALPNFTSSADKAKANQAVAYLRVIRTGEQMYFAKNAVYIACANAAEVQAKLGAEVSMTGYTFGVTTSATDFTATATRVADSWIKIVANGTITSYNLPSGVTVPAN